LFQGIIYFNHGKTLQYMMLEDLKDV